MTDQPATGVSETETVDEQKAAVPEAESGEGIEARLARMEAALKKANHEAATYRKRLEAYEKAEQERKQAEMTELEKAKQRAAQLEVELSALRRSEMQRQVAEKAGLPAALASRLKGETPEELEADAMALAETLPKLTKSPPPLPATNPGANADGRAETDAQRRARLYGTLGNPFDPVDAEKHGGGVIFKTKE